MAVVQIVHGENLTFEEVSNTVLNKVLSDGHRIKNWKRILASIETKAKLTKFVAENWKELRQREKLGDVLFMVTSGERCFRLTKFKMM